MLVRHLFRVMAALDVARNGLHRSRAVQRHDCGNVLDGLRPQTGDNVSNARAFQLKYAHGRAFSEHFIGRGVAHVQLFDGEIRRVAADHLLRVRDDREVAQTEKVHFEQTQLLDRDHRELRYHLVAVARERNIGIDRVFGDDDAGGVGRGVSRHALELARRVDQLAHLRRAVIHFFQLRVDRERLLDGHVQLVRHLLGDRVHVVVRDVERTADVADRAARSHRAEGDDLRDTVFAVLPRDVLDDLGTADVAEVDVDIRHRDALRVKEAFEIQRIMDGVEVGDAETVGNDRACRRTAARADRNALTLGVADEVGNDEEIIDKAHLGDHVDLVLQTPAHRAVIVRIAPRKALIAQLLKVFKRGIALRNVEFGQVVLAELKVDLTPLRDLDRVRERLRMLREQRRHFIRVLDVELLRFELHAGRVIDRLAHLDRHEDVLRARVRTGQIMRVVGRDKLNVQLLRELIQSLVDLFLLLDAVILYLEIEMLPVEDLEKFLADLIGLVHISVRNRARNRAREAGGHADEALAVSAQKLHVDARLHVKTLGERGRDHMDEVFVAGHVLAQQDEVAVPFAVDVAALVARMRREVDLAADDRMDALRLAGAVKVDHAVHDAVVGQRTRGLSEVRNTLDQLFDAARAVEQAVFAMHMQMGKWYHLVLLCSKFGYLFQPVAQSRLGDGRIEPPRQLGQAVGRIGKPQTHGLSEIVREGLLPALAQHAFDRGDLPRGRIRRLDEVRRLAVDLTVDGVPEVFLHLRLHQLHRGVGRADAREKVLDARAVLEVQQLCARAPGLLGRKTEVEHQTGLLAREALVGTLELEMALLVRSRDRSGHEERAAQKGRDAAVLLEHVAVEVVGDVIFSVISQCVKDAADARRVVDDELLLAAAAFRLAVHEERALQKRLEPPHDDRVLRRKANLLMREHRGVQQRAVGLRAGAARPAHGNAAQFVFNFGRK